MKRTRRFNSKASKKAKSKKKGKKTKSWLRRLRGGTDLPISNPQVPLKLNLKKEEENPTKENYLANVVVIDEITKSPMNNTKNELMTFLAKEPDYFTTMFTAIQQAIPQTVPLYKKVANFINKNIWLDCIDQCEQVCLNYIKQETQSTAYMLRVLTNSVVSSSEIDSNVNNGITFNYIRSAQPLTGKWYDDKNKFQMNFPSSTGNGSGRLIMGFGPSSSGKTRNAQGVIQLMQAVTPGFPNLFYTVDGGEFRKLSVVYQTIIKAVTSLGKYTGLTNLVLAGISPTLTNLFAAGKIKDNVLEYFQMQKLRRFNINPFKINLYVPDTLGSCILENTCQKSFQEYIELTGDKDWIGLMIYQHYKNCPYPVPYKCSGTLASGLQREKTEGKQYSGTMWYNSYLNGNDGIDKAPNYRFRLHNCIKCTSIFEDLSRTPLQNNPNVNFDNVKQLMARQSWAYVVGKYKNLVDATAYLKIRQEENERLQEQPQQQQQQPEPQPIVLGNGETFV